jgi:hypothetical protein
MGKTHLLPIALQWTHSRPSYQTFSAICLARDLVMVGSGVTFLTFFKVIASLGQAAAHTPQPMHLSSTTTG